MHQQRRLDPANQRNYIPPGIMQENGGPGYIPAPSRTLQGALDRSHNMPGDLHWPPPPPGVMTPTGRQSNPRRSHPRVQYRPPARSSPICCKGAQAAIQPGTQAPTLHNHVGQFSRPLQMARTAVQRARQDPVRDMDEPIPSIRHSLGNMYPLHPQTHFLTFRWAQPILRPMVFRQRLTR